VHHVRVNGSAFTDRRASLVIAAADAGVPTPNQQVGAAPAPAGFHLSLRT
jgi:hypothetical protein